MEDWKNKKVKLKHKFTTLMDSDMNLIEGHKEEMLVKIQEKLCITRDELLKILAGL
jgi:uncharacterized protein YjbJ (UPF0337 family)